MTVQRRDLLYDVLMHVRPLTLASARIVEATWRKHQVTVGMRAVLAVLAAGGPRPVPRIAGILDLPRQAVQRHVDDLLAQDLVVAMPNPEHRRSVLIALTDEGDQLWCKQHEQELAALEPMAVGCTRADLATAVRVLDALGADVRARLQKLRATDA